MPFADGMAWSPFDFAFMGALLFGTLLTFDVAERRATSLAVGLAGALAARFHPARVAWPLFAMSLAQLPVPLVAWLVAGPERFSAPPGAWGVLALNVAFAAAFAMSGLLFLRSGAPNPGRA